MPTKTLYVKESDLSLWEEAQKKLGESISSIVADCLRERITAYRLRPIGEELMERIVIQIEDKEGRSIKKSFVGRWLVPPDKEAEATRTDLAEGQGEWMAGVCFAIAQTKKRAIAVYTFGRGTEEGMSFNVYDSLEELEEFVPGSIIRKASPDYVQDLDI